MRAALAAPSCWLTLLLLLFQGLREEEAWCGPCRRVLADILHRPANGCSLQLLLKVLLDSALHRPGAGDLFLLRLVHLGPVGLPYLPGGLQPDHQRRREDALSGAHLGEMLQDNERFSALAVADERLVVGRHQPVQPSEHPHQLLLHPVRTPAPQVCPRLSQSR